MSAELKMVAFFQKYTEVMTRQIHAVQTQVDSSVELIMQSLHGLSVLTDAQKHAAKKAMDHVYLRPDSGVVALANSAQQSADEIFHQAQLALAAGTLSDSTLSTQDDADHLRLAGGIYSKHLEALSMMDDNVQSVLMSMVGCLSNADVIKQRLDHISDILRTMNSELAHVISDSETRFTHDSVEVFREKVLEYAYKCYSVEEERDAFKRIFGPPPQIVRAYQQKAG